MALIVETGEGLELADSYVSVDEFNAYLDAYGYQFEGDNPEITLRRATRALDLLYPFLGTSLVEEQGLHFPTSELNTVPRQIKLATMELALLMADGEFDPLAPIDGAEYGLTEYTVSAEGVGSKTKRWAAGQGPVAPQIAQLRKIDYILAGYYTAAGTSDWYQMEVDRG